MNFRYKFMQFMSGRYGFDPLSGAIVALACILSFINVIIRSWPLQIVVYALILLALFRVLSRNTAARRAENMRFINMVNTLRRKTEFQRQKKG